MSEKDRIDRNRSKKKKRITSKDIARMEQKYGMPMYKKNPDKYAKKKRLLHICLCLFVKSLTPFIKQSR